MSSLASLALAPLLGAPPYLRADRSYYDVWQPAIGNTFAGSRNMRATTANPIRFDGRSAVVPLSLFTQLISDATVVQRRPHIEVRDENDQRHFLIQAQNGQQASSTVSYDWFVGAGGPGGAVGSAQSIPMPRIVLLPEWYMILTSFSGVAADLLVGTFLTYISVPTGPPRAEAGGGAVGMPLPL